MSSATTVLRPQNNLTGHILPAAMRKSYMPGCSCMLNAHMRCICAYEMHLRRCICVLIDIGWSTQTPVTAASGSTLQLACSRCIRSKLQPSACLVCRRLCAEGRGYDVELMPPELVQSALGVHRLASACSSNTSRCAGELGLCLYIVRVPHGPPTKDTRASNHYTCTSLAPSLRATVSVQAPRAAALCVEHPTTVC